MRNERTICCCGGSSWVRDIAWLEIVGNVLMMILAFTDQGSSIRLAGFAAVISFFIYFLGLLMAIVLHRATDGRNVGCIRAWIIFKVFAVIILIIMFIVQATVRSSVRSSATTGTSDGGDFMVFAIIFVIVAIVVNGFCIGVAYIHIKDIKAGVFVI